MTVEIYTEEFVIKELKILLKELKKNKEFVYIWELFEDRNYWRQRFSEWSNKFPDNEEIQQNSDTIKDILETRAAKGLMTNKLNATWTIFHLKNNYKWVDKREIEQSWWLDINLKFEEMNDEELDKLITW